MGLREKSQAISVLVVPCSLEELKPLLEYLSFDKPGPCDDTQPIVFPRGTIMSGGRLDLCKQAVGPQGIQPVLDSMKHSSVIRRLLLGKCSEFKLMDKNENEQFFFNGIIS